MRTIIGLAGVKQSGKDTVAGIVKGLYKDVESVALADNLRVACSEAFGIPFNTFVDQRYKEIPFNVFNVEVKMTLNKAMNILNFFGYNPPVTKVTNKLGDNLHKSFKTPREILQFVGTEILRTMTTEDVHCEAVTIDSEITVITDVRFENELNYFKSMKDVKFIPIHVYRRSAEDQVDIFNGHASETSLFKFKDKCLTLDNNYSLDRTRINLQEILDKELR